jgi:two-component system cell cycle sensor histidine kinase PleC
MTDIAADLSARQPEAGKDPSRAAARLAALLAPAVERTHQSSERTPHSNEDQETLDAKMLRCFAEGRRASWPRAAALAGGAAALAANFLPASAILVFLTCHIGTLAVSYCLARSFLADRSNRKIPWGELLIAAETARGLAWALLLFFVGGTGAPAAPALSVTLLFLVGAINASASALMPGAVIAILTPITAIILLAVVPAVSAEARWPLAALSICMPAYFMLMARTLHATSCATLSHQAEKDELISDLEQAKAASDQARLRAEEANIAKSRFLAAMSHELRTPLNAILGFSEVMKNELFGSHAVGSYKEYSNDIHASGQHLLVLINEILDLSRIEAGRFELKEETVPLVLVVEECKHLMTLRAKQREIRIEAAVERNMPPLFADERAIRQIALNLLSNATKFTPRRGKIEIKIGWTSKGGQYFSVRDNGPGIPEEEIPIIMSSFGRGSLALKNAEEGSGLGLPIVKRLVELHGGTFTLKSKIRHGTEAIVIFPRDRVIRKT